MKRKIPVIELTSESFRNYGKVIEMPVELADIEEGHLSYWHDIYKQQLNDENLVLGFLQVKKQPMVLKHLERHVNNCEIFIPLNGIALMAFAPALDINEPNAEPDLDKVVAFIIDGTKSILVNKGVWHFPALPMDDKVEFLMVLPKGILLDIEKKYIGELVFKQRKE